MKSWRNIGSTPISVFRKCLHQWIKPSGYDTGIQVYNCTASSLVPLILRNESFASWYTCGPTVYDATHLGHASCYVKLDIIQRVLRNCFKINIVSTMNITDIDDKIIARSVETGKAWQEITAQYESTFWNDMKKLGVDEPNIKVRVTENIPKIVAFIGKLIHEQKAYIGQDNSVYFDVASYPKYGKLQSLNLEQKHHEAKKTSIDFALWKAKKNENEPSWVSPWGDGRPGWHIECSALASMVFGSEIDIHAGGLDLKFPHHENEEAQCCAYHNCPQWVNYWLHTGYLNVVGHTEKMSKSLKNTISIDDMLQKYSSDEFRMACMLSNYRTSMDYGDEMMQTARSTLRKILEFNENVKAYLEGKKRSAQINSSEILQLTTQTREQIHGYLKTDFNTAKATSVLGELASAVNKTISHSTSDLITASNVDAIAAVKNFINNSFSCFGFQFATTKETNEGVDLDMNTMVEHIVNARSQVRERALLGKNKDLFKVCDELRDCLKQCGVELKDHSHGTTWSLVNRK